MSTRSRSTARRAPQGSWNHGTLHGYKKEGCRCADCEGAWQRYLSRQAEYREERRRGRRPKRADTGLVRKVSTIRPSTCRCDSPIGTSDCIKCGRPVRSAA